jgi:hypothetical protein
LQVTKGVEQTIMSAWSLDTQRTHCAALSRFKRVCVHLGHQVEKIECFSDLERITGKCWIGRDDMASL